MRDYCQHPECIHDGLCNRRGEVVTEWPHRVTTVWCTGCGAMLYEWSFNLETMKSVKHYHDDVYRQYYSREGKKQLAIEALKARGWPVPEMWEDHGR